MKYFPLFYFQVCVILTPVTNNVTRLSISTQLHNMRYRDTSKRSNTIATSVRKILNNYMMHDAKVLYDTSERVTASYFRKIFGKFYTFVS